MQNYKEKITYSKFIFHIAFLRKTNQSRTT